MIKTSLSTVFLSALLLPASAAIIHPPIADAVATLGVSCAANGFPVDMRMSTEDVVSHACDRSDSFPGAASRQLAATQSSLTRVITTPSGNIKLPHPHVDARASATVTFDDPFLIPRLTTVASSGIVGAMRLNLMAPPPTEVVRIPVLVDTRGSTTLTNTINASIAFARSYVYGPGVAIDDAASNGSGYAHVRSTLFEVGTLYDFGVVATCAVTATRSVFTGEVVADNFCQALADPAFSLDQVGFDAMMGADTFALADYFAVDLSANILTAVPEPTPAAMLGLGLLVLLLKRRLRP